MFSARFQEVLEISIQPDFRAIDPQDAGFGMGLQSEQKSGLAYAYSKLFDTAVLVIP